MAESENVPGYEHPDFESDYKSQSPTFGEVNLNIHRGKQMNHDIPRDMTAVDENWKTRLKDDKLEIIPVMGDGNCLFRAVAHQVYGDESIHAIIREKVVEYLRLEKNYFMEYVDQNFNSYLEDMAKDGVWGGNVEIQAMCEIYGRPIEIYAYSNAPMRSYTNENANLTSKPPIRLSYHTRSHYNSIINPSTHCDSIDRRHPGISESEFIERWTELRAMEDLQKNSAHAFHSSIKNSRNQFAETCAESPFNDIDTAISLSLQTDFDKGADMEQRWEDQLVQKAIDASIKSNSMQEMGLPIAVQQLMDLGFDIDNVLRIYSQFEGENLPQDLLMENMELALFATLS